MIGTECEVFRCSPDIGVTSIPSAKSGEIGIGITTKDRWDDVAATLSELRAQKYGELETIVIDDGSKQPLPRTLRSKFPKVRFERVERPLGLVVQRNRLAQMLSTPYYLSLDDDSFPVAGDIGKAIVWLENHPSVAALAFYIVQRNAAVPSTDTFGEPFPVRSYIGCGHLLRRKTFLEAGGYLERLHYYAEELDFCLKALRQGFSTFAYPGVIIRHNRTPVARTERKASRYYVRNEALVGFLYFPFPFSILRVGNCLRILLDPKSNRHPITILLGWLEALYCAVTWRKLRQPLSLAQFRAWKRLPLPTQND